MADRMTIQRFPSGLLDLLGMQSTGDTPHVLNESLISTVDIQDLYLSERLKGRNDGGSVPITTTGYIAGGSSGVVPATEAWQVYGISATSVPCTVATAAKGSLVIFRQNPGLIQILPVNWAVLAGELIGVGMVFERPTIMRPGDLVSLYVTSITGAPNFNFSTQVYYAPLRV
jgi:hypothetical protein